MDELPSLERELALRSAGARLGRRYAGIHPADVVEAFVRSSFEQLEAHARVRTMIPVLAERYAEARLGALARIEGHDADHPLVVFGCAHNAGRSQMAEGFVQHHAGDRVLTWSGGSQPQPELNPVAVEAMAEVGIDISDAHPYPWTDELVRAATVLVSMGIEDPPAHEGVRLEHWELPHITGLSLEQVRPVRDDVEARVLDLLGSL